jgi:predicted AlkP superfamily phosphohydrolase/phosphomutase
MKNSVVETYNKFFNTYLTKFDTDVSTHVKNQFEVVLNYIQEGTLDIKKNFININTKLDKIRKENFREIFPEIEGM